MLCWRCEPLRYDCNGQEQERFGGAAQRRIIDARLAESAEDLKKGRTFGPFNTADEMIASMKRELKKRATAPDVN